MHTLLVRTWWSRIGGHGQGLVLLVNMLGKRHWRSLNLKAYYQDNCGKEGEGELTLVSLDPGSELSFPPIAQSVSSLILAAHSSTLV